MQGGMQRWEIWPSKTRFYAAGKLLSGPDRLSFYIALTATLLPLFAFWSAVMPWLIDHYPKWAIALQVISVYAILFALVNLFITAFMDPGIMPRRPDPSHGNPLSKKKPPSTQKITVNNIKQKVKFCDTCNIYRPPRATHCSICDNCVDRFDHHCPWVGNCVGRRNYRFFLLFVLGVSFNCIFATGVSIADFILAATTAGEHNAGARFVAGLRRSPLALPIAVFSLIVFGFVTGLGGYHIYLLSTAQTTNENLKNLYGKDKPNPYNLGLLRNCLYAFCPPHSPAPVDFEQWLHPDTAREITPEAAVALQLTSSSSGNVNNNHQQ